MKIQRFVKATIVACQSISLAAFALFPSAVFAQLKPDSGGNYSAWASNWIVVSRGNLNCRSGPGTNYSILTQYPAASIIPTYSELEGNPIRRDRQGLPWVRIKWAGTGGAPCYVRANTSFIRALDSFNGEQAACVQSGLKRGLNFNKATFDCVD
ncbi:MAG: hypothetical protein HC894_02340 [Microcoleus sp. SM1_3_4]|nr:hypothetical protein [Microcoleus sp. SM1_3_4]